MSENEVTAGTLVLPEAIVKLIIAGRLTGREVRMITLALRDNGIEAKYTRKAAEIGMDVSSLHHGLKKMGRAGAFALVDNVWHINLDTTTWDFTMLGEPRPSHKKNQASKPNNKGDSPEERKAS